MKKLLFITISALLAGSAAIAQKNPEQMEWGPPPPGLPDGALFTVLSGDPGKTGMFTIRLRFPSGYKVLPHHHPADELVTVIGGELGFGMGPKFSERKATKLARGGYVVASANMDHYAFTKDGATIQITGHGPFQIIYLNPKDDPRNKK